MSELEYQRFLLTKAKKAQADKDLELARQLQEQFNNEQQIERPTNLYYQAPSNLNSSKCLVDPSWEVIDPTPDITVLFIAFSKKFFWDSLGCVTVSWSKRMTTCAGICSYQGRGGMCRITLSEPLLKLRPRKDLVETLLHEMIHAYLFLTDHDRDRDGHGPNFHKHMYRINAEAGTNISVYHSFHDEVRLYQQHWWKCDGPCQHRKPYFGMVKRAMNRAPGPTDRWWGDHQSSCGGTFVKVQSPEKVMKKKDSKQKPVSKPSNDNDIRKYFPKSPTAEKSSTTSQVHTVTNLAKGNAVGQVISSKTSNIHGFTKSTNPPNASKEVSKSIPVFNGGGRSLETSGSIPPKVAKPSKDNDIRKYLPPSPVAKKPTTSSNTSTKVHTVTNLAKGNAVGQVISSKTNNIHGFTKTTNSQDTNKCKGVTSSITVFSGEGRSLKPAASSPKDYSEVRNHWLKKFETPSKKRPSDTDICPVPKKKSNLVDCPNCSKQYPLEEINIHLDQCLDVKIQKCPMCETSFDNNDAYSTHIEKCFLKMCDAFDDHFETLTKENKVTPCLVCGKDILRSELDGHLEDCTNMSNIFDVTNVPVDDMEW